MPGFERAYILEIALRELSELLSPVGDHLKPALGPATVKLLTPWLPTGTRRPRTADRRSRAEGVRARSHPAFSRVLDQFR